MNALNGQSAVRPRQEPAAAAARRAFLEQATGLTVHGDFTEIVLAERVRVTDTNLQTNLLQGFENLIQGAVPQVTPKQSLGDSLDALLKDKDFWAKLQAATGTGGDTQGGSSDEDERLPMYVRQQLGTWLSPYQFMIERQQRDVNDPDRHRRAIKDAVAKELTGETPQSPSPGGFAETVSRNREQQTDNKQLAELLQESAGAALKLYMAFMMGGNVDMASQMLDQANKMLGEMEALQKSQTQSAALPRRH